MLNPESVLDALPAAHQGRVAAGPRLLRDRGRSATTGRRAELERQINTLLFERLARSRDKEGLLRLACEGQEIRSAEDVFKDPLVFEFAGIPESPRLVESELEEAPDHELANVPPGAGQGLRLRGPPAADHARRGPLLHRPCVLPCYLKVLHPR